jgi:hypothetical protein
MEHHRIELAEIKESVMFIYDHDKLYIYVTGCQYQINIVDITFFNKYIYLNCPVSVTMAPMRVKRNEHYTYNDIFYQNANIDIWHYLSKPQVTIILNTEDFYKLKFTLQEWMKKKN